MSTSLYRHFASDGGLLYVGISLSWPVRTKQHAGGSRWFDQVAKVEIERFPTREAAIEAEREAIKRERPQFNIVHNRDTKPATVAKQKPKLPAGDPLFGVVKGPDAIVGPVLNYRDDLLSVIVAQGEFGTAGKLTEIVLGEWAGEVPDWAMAAADSVITIRRGDQLDLAEAREVRRKIIDKLKRYLRTIEIVETDIALAVANAARFPSAKAKRILDEVAVERTP